MPQKPAPKAAATARRAVPACAIAFLKTAEGLHDGDKRTPAILEPMPDLGGIFTEGYGHALFKDGQPVRDRAIAMAMWTARWPKGMTVADAEAQLAETAQGVCDGVLAKLPAVALNDHELGALVCLAYNIGVGEFGGRPDFADSSVRRLLAAGDRPGAANAFRSWRLVNGHVVPGLVARRERERTLFLTPIT